MYKIMDRKTETKEVVKKVFWSNGDPSTNVFCCKFSNRMMKPCECVPIDHKEMVLPFWEEKKRNILQKLILMPNLNQTAIYSDNFLHTSLLAI